MIACTVLFLLVLALRIGLDFFKETAPAIEAWFPYINAVVIFFAAIVGILALVKIVKACRGKR